MLVIRKSPVVTRILCIRMRMMYQSVANPARFFALTQDNPGGCLDRTYISDHRHHCKYKAGGHKELRRMSAMKREPSSARTRSSSSSIRIGSSTTWTILMLSTTSKYLSGHGIPQTSAFLNSIRSARPALAEPDHEWAVHVSIYSFPFISSRTTKVLLRRSASVLRQVVLAGRLQSVGRKKGAMFAIFRHVPESFEDIILTSGHRFFHPFAFDQTRCDTSAGSR